MGTVKCLNLEDGMKELFESPMLFLNKMWNTREV